MAGGTESQLVELVTRLDRDCFAPHVLCLYGARAGKSLHFLQALQENDVPVTVLDLSLTFWGKLRGIVEIARYVWCVRPDVIQAVNYHSNLLMRLARPLLPRMVRLVGCIYVEYTAKQLQYERLTSWLCAALVCNSEPLQRQVAGAVRASLVECIPNGIDVGRFADADGEAVRQAFAPGAGRVLLFLGRIARQKAPHLLVEALGAMKREGMLLDDVKLWIVGELEHIDEQARIDEVVMRYALEDAVVQLPAMVNPEAFIAAADVVALPSLWEGLPNVMLEALAAGHPVFASEAANAAGVVRHGVNGWVVPTGDVEALAAVLRDVMMVSDADLTAMREECQVSVQPFAVEAMVRRYEALYERLRARL